MKRASLLFILLLALYGCQKKPVIHSIYVDVLENGKDTITLTDYTDFEWDRALLFQEYVIDAYSPYDNHRDSIEKKFNISLKDILPYQEYEFKAPFVFLLNNKVTHIEENYRETFPNDEDFFRIEKIWIKAKERPDILEIKRENCRFKVIRNFYKVVPEDRSVLLEPLP